MSWYKGMLGTGLATGFGHWSRLWCVVFQIHHVTLGGSEGHTSRAADLRDAAPREWLSQGLSLSPSQRVHYYVNNVIYDT